MIIFTKGEVQDLKRQWSMSDSIEAPFTGQSEKPLEIYDEIQKLLPTSHNIKIFARQRNIRKNYVSVGN